MNIVKANKNQNLTCEKRSGRVKCNRYTRLSGEVEKKREREGGGRKREKKIGKDGECVGGKDGETETELRWS